MNLDIARVILSGGKVIALGLGKAFTIAVVDAAGYIVIVERLDGAPPMTVGAAVDKGYSAVVSGMSTADWYAAISSDPGLAVAATKLPRLMPLPGGVPVVMDGVTIGAVGVSGGSHEEDEAVAQAAAVTV
jgi:glc operon protein GlcG